MPSATAPIAPARQAAFTILRKVGLEEGNSDSLLHSRMVDELSAADRNLCTTWFWERFAGSACWMRSAAAFFRGPISRLPEDALLALRVGAYQLLFLDRIPVHAAIFESVEWAKHSGGARQAGLINAVLRKVAGLPKGRRFRRGAGLSGVDGGAMAKVLWCGCGEENLRGGPAGAAHRSAAAESARRRRC